MSVNTLIIKGSGFITSEYYILLIKPAVRQVFACLAQKYDVWQKFRFVFHWD